MISSFALWNLLSPLSLSGPLLVPSDWLTWASSPTPLHPCSLQTCADSRLAHLSSLYLKGQSRRLPVPSSPHAIKINMTTMPFSVPGKISRFLPFFLLFLQLMKEKHPEGQGGRGSLWGLSQHHPLKPTEPGLVWDEYRRYAACTPERPGSPCPQPAPLQWAPPQADRGLSWAFENQSGSCSQRPPPNPRVWLELKAPAQESSPQGNLGSSHQAGKGNPGLAMIQFPLMQSRDNVRASGDTPQPAMNW